MAARADLPPAVAGLLEAGLALMRRAPSARMGIVRAGEILEPVALRPEARERHARLGQRRERGRKLGAGRHGR